MVLQMEVLLFALFFISALIFFIAGKDDFGRTENKLIIKEKEKKNKEAEVIKEEKKTDNIIEEKTDKIIEEKTDQVTDEEKKEEKVTPKGNIEPQVELEKES